ncbi:DUF475 domain-containing protein [Candidatus Parcubacteria bacterium]|nr:DUF475 domain-containing protein [Candidatus Parcubacteria bacterium]
MHLIPAILTIVGLAVFEIISSIDNAVVNAEVLQTMSAKAKKWFLLWGMLFAVFMVRGLLPWAIIWATNPSLGALGAFFASFSNDPAVGASIEKSGPILLAGGGTFLIFLFFHWLFMETKNYGLIGEKFFHRQGVWFYAVISIILSVLVWLALGVNSIMAFSIVIGSTAFFITHGFKQNAEEEEKALVSGTSGRSDLSKILYLEIIDATFSIDGVLGAFAFTLSVPLIIIGSGVGAIILRKLTVSNIENVKKYIYLKNGAMYSIFFLGLIMILDAFGHHIPEWFSPVVTLGIVLYFFFKSKKHLKNKLTVSV